MKIFYHYTTDLIHNPSISFIFLSFFLFLLSIFSAQIWGGGGLNLESPHPTGSFFPFPNRVYFELKPYSSLLVLWQWKRVLFELNILSSLPKLSSLLVLCQIKGTQFFFCHSDLHKYTLCLCL